MVFNVVFRNQDDHTKNIAFLMDRSGAWQLSPAFDVAYSFNPKGLWTSKHQMSVNGKRDGFLLDDLLSAAEQTGLSKQKINLCSLRIYFPGQPLDRSGQLLDRSWTPG